MKSKFSASAMVWQFDLKAIVLVLCILTLSSGWGQAAQTTSKPPDRGQAVQESSKTPDGPQGTGDELKVYSVGGDVTGPIPIYSPPPQYNKSGKGKSKGTVELSVVVNPRGKAGEIRVVKPLNPGLDESAVNAVRKWRFKPGMRNGVPVSVRVSLQITFRLTSNLRMPYD